MQRQQALKDPGLAPWGAWEVQQPSARGESQEELGTPDAYDDLESPNPINMAYRTAAAWQDPTAAGGSSGRGGGSRRRSAGMVMQHLHPSHVVLEDPVKVKCGEEFLVPFVALDQLQLPVLLSEEMHKELEEVGVVAEPHGRQGGAAGEVYTMTGSCQLLVGFHIRGVMR